MVEEGDEVELTKDRIGIIRYKGPLDGKKGTFYGIELTKGQGKHSGIFKGKRYFICPKHKGIFIDNRSILYLLEPMSGKKPIFKPVQSYKPSNSQIDVETGDMVELTENRTGIVRYKGPLEGRRFTVYGIQLTKGDEKHSGLFKGKRYFTCPRAKGTFVGKHKILYKLDNTLRNIRNKPRFTFIQESRRHLLIYGFVRDEVLSRSIEIAVIELIIVLFPVQKFGFRLFLHGPFVVSNNDSMLKPRKYNNRAVCEQHMVYIELNGYKVGFENGLHILSVKACAKDWKAKYRPSRYLCHQTIGVTTKISAIETNVKSGDGFIDGGDKIYSYHAAEKWEIDGVMTVKLDCDNCIVTYYLNNIEIGEDRIEPNQIYAFAMCNVTTTLASSYFAPPQTNGFV